jgi:hypothetical protein
MLIIPLGCLLSKQAAAFHFYSSPASSEEINGTAKTIPLNEQAEWHFYQEWKR